MQPTRPPSRRPFNATESFPDFLGPILPEGLSPTSPAPVPMSALPSIQESADHPLHSFLQLSETPPPRPISIFQGLLGGQVDVLVQDAIDHPENYDEQVQATLAELSVSGRQPTAADLAVLDRATLDFASGQRPGPPPMKMQASAPAKKPRLVEAANEYSPQDGRAPQVEAPGGTMSAYWWLT
jgi:hypothetical protein